MSHHASNQVLNKEEEFHDDWANSVRAEEVMVDQFFEACTAPENRFIIKSLGDLRGKKVVELGCGLGEAAVYFAKQGAEVVATDISKGMCNLVERVAAKHGVVLTTAQAYSHAMPFPDATFDVVYAANLLHHVDIEQTLLEAKRILKPGGVFVSWDPLAHNPIINVYRRMAMGVRTEDEHPLKMKELAIFKKHFQNVTVATFWLTALAIFLKFYFIDRVNPNTERYWKKILTEHQRLEKTYNFFAKIDQTILKFLPFMKRYCWNVVVVATK